jgi:hypothetical protein
MITMPISVLYKYEGQGLEVAHPSSAFHPCTCGLRGGVAAVATALIGYDDIEVAVGMTMRRRS